MATGLAVRGPTGEIQQYLQSSMGELATACSGITPERMLQVATVCVYKTPKIAECDKPSILASVIQAASLGFDLSPGRGEGYLIPRWNKNTRSLECQFQPGYRGLTKLAREGGSVAFIQARVVHKGDKFRYWHEDDRLHIEHEPSLDGNRGSIRHVYALVKLTTGDILIEVMTFAEVEEIRMRSERPDSGPWKEQWGEMAKKTVIKRICKSIDQSPKLAAAIEADNREYEMGDDEPASKPQNGSGYGPGMMASPEQTKLYLDNLRAYLEKRKAQWLDRWTDEMGDIQPGIKEDVCSIFQADGHLTKWLIQAGQIDPSSMREDGKLQHRQLGRFTAIYYHKGTPERKAIATELKLYIDEQERIATQALKIKHPEIFADDSEPANDAVGDPDYDPIGDRE